MITIMASISDIESYYDYSTENEIDIHPYLRHMAFASI